MCISKSSQEEATLINQISESIKVDGSPENIFSHIKEIQRLLVESNEYDPRTLRQQAENLVYALRGAIIKDISSPSANKIRVDSLHRLLLETPSSGVQGHQKFVELLEKKQKKLTAD